MNGSFRKSHPILMATVIVLSASVFLTGCGTGVNASTTGSQQPSAASKTVTIGYVNWAEDVANTFLWKDLLDKRGYHVKVKALDAGPMFEGLAQGNLDVYLDAWLPYTQANYMKRYGSKLQNLGQWYEGPAKIGLVVPQYVTINSISQINQHVSQFDHRIVGIDPGAGEMGITKKVIKRYGLHIKLDSGSQASMLTALGRAIYKHQWIVVTGWSPHWMFAKWKLKFLKDPKGVFGPNEQLYTEANLVWAKNNPTLVHWFNQFKLTPQQLGTLEEDINAASSPSAGAATWIHDNQSVVQAWFK
ncbi:MAG: glycine betaine ABC transporter substrate-binding protein [Acidibacillus sp.]|nr:glycine betaine ABC transporter substrate-binding protein [Acidibacillus sp.]